ncbi:MAG: glycosyltransferase, partial [Thermomicrobiales bacterium]
AMVVLEAAACGVPTVGTAVGVVPDLAPGCAIAVRPGDPVALASAVVSLLTDSTLLERMRSLARRRAVEEYGVTVVVDRFVKLYEDAIGLARR